MGPWSMEFLAMQTTFWRLNFAFKQDELWWTWVSACCTIFGYLWPVSQTSPVGPKQNKQMLAVRLRTQRLIPSHKLGMDWRVVDTEMMCLDQRIWLESMPQAVDDEWWFVNLHQNQRGMYNLSSLHGLDGTILWYSKIYCTLNWYWYWHFHLFTYRWILICTQILKAFSHAYFCNSFFVESLR